MKKAAIATTLFLTAFASAPASTPANVADITLTSISNRASVRNFTDREVPDSVKELLLRAAMSAPSAVIRQPWEFISIVDPSLRAEIAKAIPNSHAAKSPYCIVVCGNMEQALDGNAREYWVQDCSAATENILIAAHSLGLGSVWCGVYPIDDRVDALRKVLRIPDSVIPLNVICIGYPDAPVAPKDKWKPEKVHHNGY